MDDSHDGTRFLIFVEFQVSGNSVSGNWWRAGLERAKNDTSVSWRDRYQFREHRSTRVGTLRNFGSNLRESMLGDLENVPMVRVFHTREDTVNQNSSESFTNIPKHSSAKASNLWHFFLAT